MNKLNNNILKRAKNEAFFNVYLYLINISSPKRNQSLQQTLWNLEVLYEQKPNAFTAKDIIRLKMIRSATSNNEYLANSKLTDFTTSENGLSSALFTKPDHTVSITYKGTGCGEWIDNGEGLSGIAEENKYTRYDDDTCIPSIRTVFKDFATDQQVEALNWYNYVLSKYNLKNTEITVSGHSKGGNKAQFITMKSDDVDYCFSFNGQGFSPEALNSFKKKLSGMYDIRQKKIYGFCADNDYVNILGRQLISEDHRFYFKSAHGIHFMESILDNNCNFNPQAEQGNLPIYIESISDELMSLSPLVRQYATLGIMNIFQKYIGRCETVNGDSVSMEKTIAGIVVAASVFLKHVQRTKEI